MEVSASEFFPDSARPRKASRGLPSTPALYPEQVVANGRFVLQRQLGQGGMGIVWLAVDTFLKEQVALKFLPSQVRNDPIALDDMRRETARSHRLTHPHIVRIHDFYDIAHCEAFISMEYVDGPNLAALRLEVPNRVLGWDFLETLMVPLCTALQYAHDERVVHRDLKPANLMLDGRGRLKLADFGIASILCDSISRASSLPPVGAGTLVYMSPQQLSGESPKVTDDIYSIGATLYELLTGKPPFYSGDIHYQVQEVKAKPLALRLREFEIENPVPPRVNDLILRCLAKDPAKRPQDATEILELLDLWTGTTTVSLLTTRSFSPVVRGRQARKKIYLQALSAAVLSAGLAWALWPESAIEGPSQFAMDQHLRGPSAPVEATSVETPFLTKAVTPELTPDADLPPAPELLEINPRLSVRTPYQASADPSNSVPEAQTQNDPVPPATTSEVEANPQITVASEVRVETGVKSANGVTALDLARQGFSHVPERYNQVRELSNLRGNPQKWRVVYRDAKSNPTRHCELVYTGTPEPAFKELGFNDRFFSRRQKALDLGKVRIDSDQALELALAIPELRSTQILEYEQRLQMVDEVETWTLELWAPRPGSPTSLYFLGKLRLNARTGAVLLKDLR